MLDANGINWEVGDYCTYTYKNLGGGVIYRVVAFKENAGTWSRLVMQVEPVFGFLQSLTGRNKRDVNISQRYYAGLVMKLKLTLIDVCAEHLRLSNLIQQIGEHLSG